MDTSEALQPLSPDLEFPGFTEYQRHRFLCCSVTKIPTIPATFWGHWEVSLCFPSIVLLLLFLSYSVGLLSLFTRLAPLGRWFSIPFSILFFLYLISYLRIITDGPGYFPFYYPIAHFPSDSIDRGLLSPTDDNSPSGIVSTSIQKVWAKKRGKPNRCIFSTIGRRIVIRPDHYCGWTESWIGKRNQKFFLLFNFYGMVYLIVFMAVDVCGMIVILTKDFSGLFVLHIVTLVLAMLFGILNCMFVRSHCAGLCTNRTQWEDWNEIEFERFNRGYCGNIEDVCGDRKRWWEWGCPISPWKGMSNEMLIEGYTRDYGKVEQREEDEGEAGGGGDR